MAVGKRMYLSQGATIRLYRKNAREAADWTITGDELVGEGASAVCYTAISGGKTGRLKEFYPRITDGKHKSQYYCQVRHTDYQLAPEDYKKHLIGEMKKEFLRAYETLEEVKSRSGANSILNNFIPPFEILYGSPGNQGEQSVYVWTPDDKMGITFDRYLDEVHKELSRPADNQLYNILVTILTVTDAVNALHSANLLHLDIKPSNFLIPYTSGNELNPGSISLFDINTLYRLGGRVPRSAGTEGYSAPELIHGKGENRSDIYSIGAMLYRSLMGPGDLYSDTLYGNIPDNISSSKLLNAAETNGQKELRDRLTSVLQNCLCAEKEARYESCEDLADDLRKAIVLLEPAVKRKYLGPYRRFEIVNVELQKQKNPNAIIYSLLYKNPIYNYIKDNEKNIRVMILGSGEFAQSFIGIALQSCQAAGREVTITVVADDGEQARKDYLKTRPAAAGFVNINGSLNNASKEIYGTVNFVQGSFNADDRKHNENEIKTIIKDCKMPQYVFIALGSRTASEDALNKEMARTFAECVKSEQIAQADMGRADEKEADCNFINYVITDKEHFAEDVAGNPVFVYESITAESIDPQLDRMAFNTHLSWNNTLNLNYDELYEQFRTEKQGYNYNSSIAFVLSIPYKLWSMGIRFNTVEEAAEKFRNVIDTYASYRKEQNGIRPKRHNTEPSAAGENRRKEAELYLQLIQLEHRRWVLEKVCDKQGWQAPKKKNGKPDYESCILRGSVKDNKNRTHPCIVRSSAKMPLQEKYYTDRLHENWNKASEKDNDLDELDRLSIDLHRMFFAKAQEVIVSRPLQSGDVPFIEKLLGGEAEEVVRAFNRYRYCIRNILNGNQAYSRQFYRIEKDFAVMLEQKASAQIKAEVLGNETTGGRLERIRHMLFPVIESNMYRDYKALDEALVQNIPFILTFKPQADLVLAFEDDRLYNGRNDIVFKNVAGATALNPKNITYLYYYDRYTRKDLLLRKLASVTNYLSKRALRCAVNLVIAFSAMADKERNEEELNQLIADVHRSTGIRTVTGKVCFNEAEACEFLAAGFDRTDATLIDGTTQLFVSAAWNAALIQKLKTELPYFEFSSREKRFMNCSRCGYLKYLENGNMLARTYLRIEDMFSLMNAYSTKYSLPEFAEEYETLWEIYTGGLFPTERKSNWRNGVKNWNRLCDQLKDCAEEQDLVFRVEVNDRKDAYQTFTYSFPSKYLDDAKAFYNALCSLGIISAQFKLTVDTTDWCEGEIRSQFDLEPLLFKVADEPEKYLAGQNLTVRRQWVYKTGKEFFVVKYDNLRVAEWQLDEKDCYSAAILKELEKHRYINNLRTRGGTAVPGKNNVLAGQTVSFRYASPSIKKLLTTAGEILELYTYYEVLKTGSFDDAACGCEFQWERGGVLNELDVILTRGFHTIIIECKARMNLDQNFYHKLLSIAGQFGVAVTKVMIANTYEHNDILDELNRTAQARGSQMDIITIREPEQIKNIGRLLSDIMDGEKVL